MAPSGTDAELLEKTRGADRRRYRPQQRRSRKAPGAGGWNSVSPRRAGASCGGASSHRRRRGARATEGVLERIQRHTVYCASYKREFADAPRTSASHGSGGGLLRSRSASMEEGRRSTAKSAGRGRRREGRATTTDEIRGTIGRRTNETEQTGTRSHCFHGPVTTTPGCLFDVTARSILQAPSWP